MSIATKPSFSSGTRTTRRAVAHMFLSTMTVILVVLIFGQYYPERFLSGHNDFQQLYSGAALVGTVQLYSFDANKRVQQESAGQWLKGVYYSRLPFYAAALKPLSRLPYRHAYWVFQTISILSYAGFVFVFLSRYHRFAVWAGTFLPLIIMFLVGQDVSLLLLFCSLFVLCACRGRDFLAGLLLSLCMIKFHLFVLVPFVLVIHRRWHIIAGASFSVAALLGVSFAASGSDWPIHYMAALSNPEIHPGTDHMPTMYGLFLALGMGGLATAIGSIVLVALFCWAVKTVTDFPFAVGLALMGGLLIGVHAYVQDCTLLLIAVPLLWEDTRSRIAQVAQLALMTPIPYFMLLQGYPYNILVTLLMIVVAFLSAWTRIIAQNPGLRLMDRDDLAVWFEREQKPLPKRL